MLDDEKEKEKLIKDKKRARVNRPNLANISFRSWGQYNLIEKNKKK